jgi:glycolate oxidase FAD binding subunit
MDAAVLRSLTDLVGAPHCLAGTDRGPFAVDGRTPGAVVFPGSADEMAQVVRLCADTGVPVIPWGGGTAMSLGPPPPDGALVVGTRRLARVLEHEPGDLTATVEAGITLDLLQATLGQRGQWWPLDPPQPARATVGGVLATNAAGPRRHGYGTARDVVLGIRVVGADGRLVRAGGKVVKNVAGYDLAKLYIGALGTLGVIVDVTLKLRPRPEAESAVAARFGDLDRAAAAATRLLASPLQPHAVELLGPGAAEAAGLGPAGAALLVGFDGLLATVEWQGDEAARLLGALGAADVRRLDGPTTAQALAVVRDLGAVPAAAPVAVAEVGILPADLGGYLSAAEAAAREAGLGLQASARAGEGIVTLVFAAAEDRRAAGASTVQILTALRARARATGGHLTLVRAPLAVKEAVGPWDPPGPAGGLMRAVKSRLDPRRILNPGRFVGGV